MEELEITAKTGFNNLKIFIQKTLHLHIERDKYLGLQSWKHQGKMCIEITLTTNKIILEYDTVEKWEKVLNLLNDNL